MADAILAGRSRSHTATEILGHPPRPLPSDFYVYLHRRSTNGEVFYIGKGRGCRAWQIQGRSERWMATALKRGCIVEIIQSGMQEWWAFELELDLVALHQGRKICNVSDGGDGASGYKHRPESLEKMRMAQRGRKFSPERCAINARAQTGRKHSDETKKRMSASAIRSPEHRAAISRAQKNRVVSAETRAKVSASKTGAKIPKPSAETIEKYAEARRQWWKRAREARLKTKRYDLST